MFTNLIESSSHAHEFKRRGSFFLFTTVTYFLLFAIAGLASIYAYDARLEDQNLEEIVMLSPVDLPAPPVAPVVRNTAPPRASDNNRSVAVRDNPMASVSHPELAPATISAKPNTNPPVPDRGPWVAGSGNSDPATIGGPSNVGNGVGPGNRRTRCGHRGWHAATACATRRKTASGDQQRRHYERSSFAAKATLSSDCETVTYSGSGECAGLD